MTEQAPNPAKFTNEDTEKLVEFLNFVAVNATFNGLTVKSLLQFSRLLNWTQTQLLPKIEAHKFEIISVKHAEKKGKK